MEPERTKHNLLSAIAALDQQRATLGDAVVDAALRSLQQQLEGLAPATSPVTERRLRQVSILFLDIVGSTAMGQLLEPEDIANVVDGALADFSAVVAAHGGEVLQYAGDNLLAAFGADGAREDDAERAVRCGLALLGAVAPHAERVRREHGYDGFNARVGIHTGSVLRGGGVDHDNTLRGQAVNIAARMEQTAPPGRLRVSQDTWALVRGLFDAEAQPSLSVKGSDAAVASWLVLGDKPRPFRLPTRGIEGLETPLVGREAEREALDAALHAVHQQRRPAVVTLLADAGLGKSRLLQEFQHRLATDTASFWLLLARSQPAGQLQPYGLLRDLLARRFEIADSDSADTARAKLVQGLKPWLHAADDPAPELLGHLVGIDFGATPAVQACGSDARLLRTLALAGLRRLLERMAAHDGSRAVLLLDDLHWSDDASLDALQSLLTEVQGALLVVACARPALLERRPAWGEGLPQHVRLSLSPLNGAQRHELTQQLLRRLAAPAPVLADLIERRAEGNPYHAEELLRMLLDHRVIESSGGDWVFHAERLQPDRLPTTLTGVLQSRLDTLPAIERRSLQLASVIGPVFWDAALGELDPRGPSALPALQIKAMVFERPTSAFDDSAERAFQHHLLHQVSYATLLRSERQTAHARAAKWLTERVAGRSDEYLAITAQHHERAGQPQLAAEWFERASDQADERFASQLALDYLDRAMALRGAAATPPVQLANLRRRALLCDRMGLYGPERDALDAMLALAREHGDDPALAFVLTQRTLLHDRQGRSAEAEADALAGAEVARRIDDAARAALCHGNLAWLTMGRSKSEALAHLERGMHWAALARARMVKPNDGMYEVQLLLVANLLHRKYNDHAARGAALMQAVERAASIRSPRLQAGCLDNLVRWALDCAQLDLAAGHIQAMLRLAHEFDLRLIFVQATHFDGMRHLIAGRHDEALAAASDALRLARAMGAAQNELMALDLQGEAFARSGRWQAAAACFDELEARRAPLPDARDTLSARLRRDAARWHCGGSRADSALQDLLTALQDAPGLQAIGCGDFGISALGAAHAVLRGHGHADAPRILALAVSAVELELSGHADPALRRHIGHTLPWMREVLDAAAAA